jgi:hypothetical protein
LLRNWALIAGAGLAFGGALAFAWLGWLGGLTGLLALLLTVGAGGVYLFARRGLERTARRRVDLAAKVLFTVGGFVALLRHPIALEHGTAPLYDAIAQHLTVVDPATFFMWAAVAMAIKFVGVLASATGWYLLLRGQRVRLPYWRTVVTGFLIGRFIGTFMPSTLGLDGYTLYEAGRVSNQWHRVIIAKVVEKFTGAAALFGCILVTLPAGYFVFERVAGDRAWLLTVIVGVVSASISGGVLLGFARPALLRGLVGVAGRFVPRSVRHHVDRFTEAVEAYQGRLPLLLGALAGKVVSHFNTAVVYWCTALAIGVVGAEFLPIVFGSLIQIVGTLLSPTIAGEGAREALQALLLTDYYDANPGKAVLAAALGFVAAEAATMWGGAFLWTRTPSWRPTVCEVDGVQVDYAWMRDDGDEFSVDIVAKRIAEARAARTEE